MYRCIFVIGIWRQDDAFKFPNTQDSRESERTVTKSSSNGRRKALFGPWVSVWDGAVEEVKEAAGLLLVHPSRRATRCFAAPIRPARLPRRRKPGGNEMEIGRSTFK
jgi:hypothetical protein